MQWFPLTPARSLQREIVSICLVSGNCCWQMLYVYIKQKGSQNWSMWDSVLKASHLALLSKTGGENETAVADKLHDH